MFRFTNAVTCVLALALVSAGGFAFADTMRRHVLSFSGNGVGNTEEVAFTEALQAANQAAAQFQVPPTWREVGRTVVQAVYHVNALGHIECDLILEIEYEEIIPDPTPEPLPEPLPVIP